MKSENRYLTVCAWCGGEFFAQKERGVKYCSQPHNMKAYRFRIKVKKLRLAKERLDKFFEGLDKK